MTPPEFKFYPCENEALEMLKTYNEGYDRLHKKQVALQEEYQEKLLVNQKESFAELGDIWRRMAAIAGIDPSIVSFSNPEYSVETKYLDQGFGGIVYQPQPRNPFLNDGSEEVSDDEPAPEKPLLN